jgi:hypothetical protein
MSSTAVAADRRDANDYDGEQDDSSKAFDAMRLFDAFAKCLHKSAHTLTDYDDVNLRDYLLAYEEISKFLNCLGTVFMFVTTDINDKIRLLDGYLKEKPEHYTTIHSLVRYEHSANMLHKPHSASRKNAARNILRLHRALLFIYKFLERLYSAEANAKSPHICTEVYEATLAKHHSWMVRQAAKLGMYTLPRREALIELMIKDRESHDQTKFTVFIQTVEKTFTITQCIYEKYEILDLP